MTQQLIDENRSLQRSLEEKVGEIGSLKAVIAEKEKSAAALADQNNVLKMAGSLKGDDVDTSTTKRRINELVREIDKCIALLNK